jgi:hypothetical protein
MNASNTRQRRAPNQPLTAQRPDIKRFQPNTPTARTQIDFLVERGAEIVAVRATQVTLKRGSQTAIVDAWGRVTWAH